VTQPSRFRAILALAAALTALGQEAVFRSGTRLVEVDVVVRDKNGPVIGLTKDDFALYDCSASERSPYPNQRFNPCKGRRERIDLFREVSETSGASAVPAAEPTPLPPGAVSNRTTAEGTPITSATVVIVDQLNTPFDLKEYERTRAAEFLQNIGANNRVALYSLGKDLHLLQDFTGDPKKLMASIAKLDSGDQLTAAADLGPAGGGLARQDERVNIATDAIEEIVKHLQGVPGRKSVVWIAQSFDFFNPRFGQPTAQILLGQANVAVYPVMVRSIARAPAFARGMPPYLAIENQTRKLGESLGGSGFADVTEALTAVRTAEEDAKNYYVLGFYPAEEDLDGSSHQITLELPKAVTKRPDLTVHYRQTYSAQRVPASGTSSAASVTELFRDPLNAAGIGLTASIAPDNQKQGGRLIQVAIDAGDIRYQKDGDHFVGSLQVAMRLESTNSSGPIATNVITSNLSIKLSEAEVVAAKGAKVPISIPLPADLKPGSVHIVVRDTTNGAVGSLRVPISAGS